MLADESRHSIWQNPRTGALTAVPRHSEIKDLMAPKICNDLDISRP